MSDKLTIRRRKNRNGQTTVAPFINGYNVCDLPPKLWVPEVQTAIISAYELGRMNAVERVKNSLPDVPMSTLKWEEEAP